MVRDEGRTYRPARERREEVIARAIELFAEHGPETSLRSIGEAIGVSHAALRYHFPSRDELLVEVYRAHEAAEREKPEPPADIPDEVTQSEPSAVGVMENSAVRNRAVPGLVELYATLTTDALRADRHPVTHEFIKARFQRVRAELAQRVRDGQAAGLVNADLDPEDAAALIAAASDGLQLQWLIDPDAVDVHRALTLLERLTPADDVTGDRDGSSTGR